MAFNGSILIDHFKNPRNKGTVTHPDVHREVHNRKCGDRLFFTARIRQDKLEEVRFEGEGCFFCLASASIACSTLSGMSVNDALKRTKHIRKWIGGSEDESDGKGESGDKSRGGGKGRVNSKSQGEGVDEDDSDRKGEGGGESGSMSEDSGKSKESSKSEGGGENVGRLSAPDDEEQASLGEIRAYPMRISCVDLAWEGMERILSRNS